MWTRLLGALCCGSLISVEALASAEVQVARAAAVPAQWTSDFAVAAVQACDLDPRPGSELLVLGRGGEVRVLGWESAQKAFVVLPGGSLQLPDPKALLVSVLANWADLGGGLATLSARGFELYAWQAGQGFRAEALRLAPRARFDLLVGVPAFADFLVDLDEDGQAELVVPGLNRCEIWRLEPREKDGLPQLTRKAEVHLRSQHVEQAERDHFADDLQASFALPGLQLRDFNGDGRDDLLVESGLTRAFHMQRSNGAIEREADVRLDLGLFRDNDPSPGLAPGEVLSNADADAQLVSADLDGDLLVDHIITQGRKVWIFRGTAAGPQFLEPVRILKASEAVTAALVFDVDQDGSRDLVLLKVRVPEMAQLVLGLLSDWEVGAHVVGYANQGQLELATRASWERDLTLVLPPLLDVLRAPERWLARFEALGEDLRTPVIADLGADGQAELVLPQPAEGVLALWRAKAGQEMPALDRETDGFLRELLFDNARLRYELEDLLQSLSDQALARVRAWTQGREPDQRLPLRERKLYLWLGLLCQDFDGDGDQDLLCGYESLAQRGLLHLDLVQ